MAAKMNQDIEDGDYLMASLAAANIKDDHENTRERKCLMSQASQTAHSILAEPHPLSLANLEAESQLVNLMAFPAVWERIFLHLENFGGLLQMRRVCKTWRDYIDQWIMVPGKKKQFVQRYLIHPWLCHSLQKSERTKTGIFWSLEDVSDSHFQAIGDFSVLIQHCRSPVNGFECCVFHKGQYLGKVSLKSKPFLSRLGVEDILLLNKRELLIMTRIEEPATLLVWRLHITVRENTNQLPKLKVTRVNDHPLLKGMQILTLHDIIGDVLVVCLRTTARVHQLKVTSLRYNWQKDMTTSRISDCHLAKGKLWMFGWDGRMISVPDDYWTGRREHTAAESENKENQCRNSPKKISNFIWNYYNKIKYLKTVAITENFICQVKKTGKEPSAELTIESISISDDTFVLCSTQKFSSHRHLSDHNKNFAVFLVSFPIGENIYDPKFLVFSDKEEMWFTFRPKAKEIAGYFKIIGNILIVGYWGWWGTPFEFNISVHDLEQRGKTVRTMCMLDKRAKIVPWKMHTSSHVTPSITTNMVYYFAVNGMSNLEDNSDEKFDLCDVVKSFELRPVDPGCDRGSDG